MLLYSPHSMAILLVIVSIAALAALAAIWKAVACGGLLPDRAAGQTSGLSCKTARRNPLPGPPLGSNPFGTPDATREALLHDSSGAPLAKGALRVFKHLPSLPVV